MEDAHITEDHLLIHERTYADTDGEEVADLHDIPLAAVASYSELLGYSNAVDVVSAITAASGDVEGAIAEPLMVLTYREQAREQAAAQAVLDHPAVHPRSPALAGALAAYEAMCEISGTRDPAESLLVRCQKEARRKLGLPDPVQRPSIQRGQHTLCDPAPHLATEDPAFGVEDRQRLAAVLASKCSPDDQDEDAPRWLDFIQARREAFCHSLTGSIVDPLTPAAPEPQEQPLTMEALRDRYRSEDA